MHQRTPGGENQASRSPMTRGNGIGVSAMDTRSRRLTLMAAAQKQLSEGQVAAAKQSAVLALACVGRKNPQLRASMRAWHRDFLKQAKDKPLFPKTSGGMAILPAGPDTTPR